MLKGSLAYAVCNNGIILKRTDANWTEMNTGVPNNLYGISQFGGNTSFLACGANGIILKTTNGNNWQVISSPTDKKLNAIMGLYNNGEGLIIGDGVILRTTNSGDTWSIVYNNPGQEIYSITSSGANARCFAAGANGFMVTSTNNGVTWSQIDLGITNTLYDVLGVWETTVLACGTNGILLKSTNQGNTWRIENSSTSNTLRSLQMVTPARAAAVGDYSTVVRNENIFTGISQLSSIIPSEFNLSQNYPNPFNPETKIKFNLKARGDVLLEVYSSARELISTLVKSNLNAGEYEYTWNAVNYPSGIYFYRLQTEGFIDTKKMILLK